MRTVIYARFSSDNQNPKSADDQIAECRARASREGWTVIATFQDEAVTGAGGIGEQQRPGLAAVLATVERGGVDQVLAESTSRIARHPADAHVIRERIEYAGARLFTLNDGHVTPIIGFVKGFVDAQFRTDLASNVRRGQRRKVAAGRSSGSLAYGYRKVLAFDDRGEPVRGLREIDPDQAAIVRRIFTEFAAGMSARAIAARLNQEGIPGPKQVLWKASTLRGSLAAGHGILRNRTFIGKLVYGRTKSVRNPTTRRLTYRPNPEDNKEYGEAPHLRIVDDDLWAAVQARLDEYSGGRPERHRRPKRLLSGLGVCGICGGTCTIVGQDNWGCTTHRNGGNCSNNRNIKNHLLERRVLADFKAGLLAPEVVAEYVREYHRDYARRAADLGRERSSLDRRIAEAERKMERLAAAIADGGAEFSTIRDQLASARADKLAAERDLASMEALPVIALHPNLADDYRREVEELERSLLANDEASLEAVPRLRAMIARIIFRPAASARGVEIEVVRRLDEVLSLATTSRSADLR